MLIYSNSELISMYPHHDFSSLTGFENVKKTLDEVVINTENKERARAGRQKPESGSGPSRPVRACFSSVFRLFFTVENQF